ncbi:MAG: hypothetical protein DSY58_06845 [Desulfobulbus sp.]|nr:MAG: hypothetical protein DSY58_06845 [Desulfobulbus sp.]
MFNLLMTTLLEHRLLIMAVFLVLLIIFNTKSTGRNKFICLLTTLLALSILYELVTDEPVTRIPRKIDRFFNQPSPKKTQNVHYYSLPKETLPPAE